MPFIPTAASCGVLRFKNKYNLLEIKNSYTFNSTKNYFSTVNWNFNMSFFKSIKKTLGIEIERPSYEVLQKLDDHIEIRKYEGTIKF